MPDRPLATPPARSAASSIAGSAARCQHAEDGQNPRRNAGSAHTWDSCQKHAVTVVAWRHEGVPVQNPDKARIAALIRTLGLSVAAGCRHKDHALAGDELAVIVSEQLSNMHFGDSFRQAQGIELLLQRAALRVIAQGIGHAAPQLGGKVCGMSVRPAQTGTQGTLRAPHANIAKSV